MQIHSPFGLDNVSFVGAVLNVIPAYRQRVDIELVVLVEITPIAHLVVDAVKIGSDQFQ